MASNGRRMTIKNILCFFFTPCLLVLALLRPLDAASSHPLYLGITGGYGSTTWQGLVPSAENQNAAMNMTTPTIVEEGGGVWGAFAGYDFSPYFALEGAYMHFPNATVQFAPFSLFSFEHDDLTEFVTRTETLSLIAKIMLFIPNTKIRAYSGLGVASIHRNDLLNDNWRYSPSFAAGFNYDFTPHIMGEIAGSYTAGYGEAQINPTDVYFPFLYAAYLRLAYRF
jgi:hypothetical protein